MKISINAKLLKEALENNSTTTSKNNQNQILKGILFQTEGESLCLRSTNISTGYEKVLNCKVIEEGSFVISSETINRIFSSININEDSKAEIEFKENVCSIKVDNHSVEAKTLSFESFPALPDVVGENFKIDAQSLIYGLKQVVFSVAKTEIKPEISGVHVYSDVEQLVFVGTDSYRLSEKKIETKQTLPSLAFIIPEKNVKDIIKIFNENKNELEITVSKNSLSIKTPEEYFVTRLIEGNFPNYKQIIPQNPESVSVFLKEDISRSLKIVSFFSDKTEQITLECKETDINIFAQNFEIGSATENINADTKGENFTVKINSRYFEEFLSQTRDASVIVKFTSQNKPIIFQGIQDNNFLYLIMPSYR